MATGRSNKLTGQTGEFLVAAELSRLGYIATPFAGNVPHYDIIASDDAGKHVSIQVKASRSGSWQLNVGKFCEISFDGEKQIVGRAKKCPINRLVFVFVITNPNRSDKYFVLSWRDLRTIVIRHHTAYLKRHDGRRPLKWDSLHSKVTEKDLAPFEEEWSIVQGNLK